MRKHHPNFQRRSPLRGGLKPLGAKAACQERKCLARVKYGTIQQCSVLQVDGTVLMSRLIFLAAVVAVVYLLLKSYRNRISGAKPSVQAEPPARAEDMVRCVHCGVHLPRSESIMAGGKFFCSEEHRRAHQPPAGNNGG
ncbi:MAG TPA: PP0621 family protein [Gallionellaceae bacterium]